MKRTFKIIFYFVCTLAGIIFSLMAFLLIYHSVLENRLINQNKNAEKKNSGISVPDVRTSVPIKEGLNLLPVPQKVQFTGGTYIFPTNPRFYAEDSVKKAASEYLNRVLSVKAINSITAADLIFRYNKVVPAQGYLLNIQPSTVTIEYNDHMGLYYGIVTLKVLNHNYNGVIPCVKIEDFPDLAVRGVMLDISRDKVPKLETLLKIVQILSDLKYNHLELYIEGFSFAYPSFKRFWEENETPLTGEEIKQLDTFCKNHFMDLVPNQNTFGHMMAWLNTSEYGKLAECPQGYKVMGLKSMKGTLDPSDPGSIELISKMTDDLLPNFSSASYNVNLDEPLELGLGKSKKLVKEIGEGEVYLQYMLKVHKIVSEKGKKMLMWGDVLMKHPKLLTRIPKDITILDWGYEASYPFERHCRTLQSSGLSYMVCPGTNSWASISGRTDNMLQTISSAAVNGAKFGARGILITDWGDLGNWQYPPVSFAGFAAGATMGWNSKTTDGLPLGKFLSSYMFNDKNSIMGDLALELGKYYRFEEKPVVNMTTTFMAFQIGLREKLLVNEIYAMMNSTVFKVMNEVAPEMAVYYENRSKNAHPFDYEGFYGFLKEKELLLEKSKLLTEEGRIMQDEFRNTIRLLRAGVELQYYIDHRYQLTINEEKRNLITIRNSCLKYLEENYRLWNIRNKPGGYERSISAISALIGQIDDRLLILEKSLPRRQFDRFFEKIKTAAMVLVLKVS